MHAVVFIQNEALTDTACFKSEKSAVLKIIVNGNIERKTLRHGFKLAKNFGLDYIRPAAPNVLWQILITSLRDE